MIDASDPLPPVVSEGNSITGSCKPYGGLVHPTSAPFSNRTASTQSLLADDRDACGESLVEWSRRSGKTVRFISAQGTHQPVSSQAVLQEAGDCTQPQPMQTSFSLSPMDMPQTQSSQPEPGQASLRCVLAGGGTQTTEVLSQVEALRLIAEGTTCAITGPAFDQLLQQAEPAVMASVLQSLAVAARMQSHQKAQLVRMLSCQGLAWPNKQHFKVTFTYIWAVKRPAGVPPGSQAPELTIQAEFPFL